MKFPLLSIVPTFYGVFSWALAGAAELTSSPQASPRVATTASPAMISTPTPVAGAVEGTPAEFGQSSVDFTWLFLKTIFAMIIVIALAIVVLRYIIPRISLHKVRRSQADMEILDRIPLESKKMLYIIRVEDRRLLISSSEHHMGLITELAPQDEKDNP